MIKKISSFISLFCLTLVVSAQEQKEINLLTGEKWWGGATSFGNSMPFSQTKVIDLRTRNFNNQTVSLFVSNKGRYLWSEAPMEFQFTENQIKVKTTRGKIELGTGGNTLREAYLAACNKYFPSSGKIPPELFFSKPQYNTWIELVYNQNQEDILNYARNIVKNGFPAGILMIDDNWQKYYGNFEFRPDKFPNPKALINELHKMGFKVLLWVSPFVSPDSQEFRNLQRKGFLVKKKNSKYAALLRWWNGFSACYDFSNPNAFDHFTQILKKMQKDYGIDGFKFDAGDPERYLEEEIDVFDKQSFDVEQTFLWAKLGLEFPYNEYRACWQMGGQPLVQRLGDKTYSWDGVSRLVPDMIACGLLGYAYTCPDMIGGGEFSSFQGIDPTKFDQSLIVRSCQIHSMMPMMQFSVAPWRILSKENLEICLKYAKWHEQLGDYILQQAKKSAKTGEPIVQHMEYAFPNQGFEDCKDQYMLGDTYLVAPIMEKSNVRSVKLPKGKWKDDKGKVYKGGKSYKFTVPLDRLLWFTPVK